ncbi:hypothetical protein [Sphingomonas sanxanigenens]|uniref:hypothetical protein n=1 Tax=Sphingomonas sanxanigenens TaxID=397260 RepID=UPI0004BCC5AE|nr:hypothetical protein [Sphingomonas sanxanigenens]
MPLPMRRRARPIALALAAWGVAGAACLSTATLAQSPEPVTAAEPAPSATAAPGTVQLTDAQREAILNASTEASAAAARGERTASERPDRRIHGEMGFMVGSHGTRGVYGTADIPLGENAGATVSFESSRFGYGGRGGRVVDPRLREDFR